MTDRVWWMRRTRRGNMPVAVWLRLWWHERKQPTHHDDGYPRW